MNTHSEIESTKYSLEELILFAGVSYNSITNAIDNGEVEVKDSAQLQNINRA